MAAPHPTTNFVFTCKGNLWIRLANFEGKLIADTYQEKESLRDAQPVAGRDKSWHQEHFLISSDWGNIAAELADNAATRSLVEMPALGINMRDHLRQEKTGNLPSPLPVVARQLDFSTGTLGLWGSAPDAVDGSSTWRANNIGSVANSNGPKL